MYEEVIQQIKSGQLEPLDNIYIEHARSLTEYVINNFNSSEGVFFYYTDSSIRRVI